MEPAIDSGMPIVDAHHHLWDMPGWRYLLDDYLADLRCGHNVVASVFVQCFAMHRPHGPPALRPVGETEFANGVAAMSASGRYGPAAVCKGIVGYADLRLGDAVEDVLDGHLRAGGHRFRGIRQISAWDADPAAVGPANAPAPGLLADEKFREGFGRLAAKGLSFDAWLLHPQIDELAALADAFPETDIILDHLGTPLGVGGYAGRRDEVFAAWRASMQRLARQPNVWVKLGGMAQAINGFGWPAGPLPPSSERLAQAWLPYFETCIEAFSPARCMFESNFPVDKEACSSGVFWNACKRMVAGYGAGEKADLFHGTASRAYRLGHSQTTP